MKAYYNLGNCYLNSGQIALALDAYQTILELDPRHARAHFAIGQALARSGRLPEALLAFQEALGLRGEFPECHLAYARALEGIGRVREALHHYRVYVNDPGAQDQRDEVQAHIGALSQLGYALDRGAAERAALERGGLTGGGAVAGRVGQIQPAARERTSEVRRIRTSEFSAVHERDVDDRW